MSRITWAPVIIRAAAIVRSYDTSVTLRQLFYRLVSEGTIPNTPSAYKRLSELTAEARREGWFPDLIDQGRIVHEHMTFRDPLDARTWLHEIYRLDRTIGQDVSLYLGVEKAGMVAQLDAWFGDLGIPVVALGGYSSQSYVDVVSGHTGSHDRPAVLLYGGDFDPSGEDIDRDFAARSDCWAKIIRVALNADQVTRYDLARNLVVKADPRAPAFCDRWGLDCERVLLKGKPAYRYQQVELDALDPDDLRALYQAAIDRYWDMSAYDRVMAREARDRTELDPAA